MTLQQELFLAWCRTLTSDYVTGRHAWHAALQFNRISGGFEGIDKAFFEWRYSRDFDDDHRLFDVWNAALQWAASVGLAEQDLSDPTGRSTMR